MTNRVYENIKVEKVEAATAAGTTAIESAIVDLSEYEGVAFVVSAGAITSGGVQSIKVEVGDDSALSDAADSGVAIAVADDDDSQSFLLDYAKSGKRYARCTISRATQNSAWGEIYALRYGAGKLPVVNTVADTLTLDNN
jgi:hypothetical protein